MSQFATSRQLQPAWRTLLRKAKDSRRKTPNRFMRATDNGLQPRTATSELVAASWLRCRQQGLSSHLHVQQEVVAKRVLETKQERSRELRLLALQEMRLLEHVLVETGRVILLADYDGVVLDSQGDDAFLGKARMVSLIPGASWREQVAGTNAIGMALIENHFVQIVGGQHFFDENRFLTCSAMPIHAPEGLIAGVLDISGHAGESAALAARLVRHAVAHIEHRWVTKSAKDLLVHIHQHPSWLGTPDEGVLTFEDDLLTSANTRALTFLGLNQLAIRRACWRDLFQQKPRFGLQELRPMATPGLLYANIARVCIASTRIAAAAPIHGRPVNLDELKDEALRQAVASENGNIAAAARKLGIHRSTVYRRLTP